MRGHHEPPISLLCNLRTSRDDYEVIPTQLSIVWEDLDAIWATPVFIFGLLILTPMKALTESKKSARECEAVKCFFLRPIESSKDKNDNLTKSTRPHIQ